MGGRQAESIAALMAREEEVAREWEWLHEAVNRVARAMADGDRAGESTPAATDAFRLLHHQAMAVGQRRVELQLRLAALETRQTLGPGLSSEKPRHVWREAGPIIISDCCPVTPGLSTRGYPR